MHLLGQVGQAAPIANTAATDLERSAPSPSRVSAGAPSFIFLRVLLFLLAVGSATQGAFIMREAKTSMHEIEAYLCFTTAAVFFCTAAIIEALRQK